MFQMSPQGKLHALTTLPAADCNFTSILSGTADRTIREAIAKMQASNGQHKMRIKACERELKRREREGIA